MDISELPELRCSGLPISFTEALNSHQSRVQHDIVLTILQSAAFDDWLSVSALVKGSLMVLVLQFKNLGYPDAWQHPAELLCKISCLSKHMLNLAAV